MGISYAKSKNFSGGDARMQSTLASLLLISAVVVSTCIVISYGIVIMEETVQIENFPQLDRLRSLGYTIENQTQNLQNQTKALIPNEAPPK